MRDVDNGEVCNFYLFINAAMAEERISHSGYRIRLAYVLYSEALLTIYSLPLKRLFIFKMIAKIQMEPMTIQRPLR